MKRVRTRAAPVSGAPRKPLGRPRCFDCDRALEAAMQVFWEKGFEAASIGDLTRAMGINPPSLYAAFGDKETLFLTAIERYERARSAQCPYSTESTARAAVERLLTYMAGDMASADHPRGCMLVMAATTTTSSPKLQQALAKRRSEARTHLKERIEQGIREGDVPRAADAGALADFYVTIFTGMAMQAREGASRKSLMATAERAMQVFPAPAPARRQRRESAPA